MQSAAQEYRFLLVASAVPSFTERLRKALSAPPLIMQHAHRGDHQAWLYSSPSPCVRHCEPNEPVRMRPRMTCMDRRLSTSRLGVATGPPSQTVIEHPLRDRRNANFGESQNTRFAGSIETTGFVQLEVSLQSLFASQSSVLSCFQERKANSRLVGRGPAFATPHAGYRA